MHPLMTAQLVRRQRAALDAEPRDGRPIRQAQRRARADPGRGRFVLTARSFAHHVRALVARAT